MTKTYFLLLFTWLFLACEEPRKACLDIEATNFDASADTDCCDDDPKDCCCEYPKLVMEVEQVYDTVPYVPGALLELAPGRWGRINSLNFFLSDFQVFRNDEKWTVADSVSLKTYPDSISTLISPADFTLFKRVPNQVSIGEFRTVGDFDKIAFSLGLGSVVNRVIPERAPSSNRLRLAANEGLWAGADTGFVWMRLILERDTFVATPPDTLLFTGLDFPKFDLDFPGLQLRHPAGYDFLVKLKVDLQPWFDGTNWSETDISVWKTQIVPNLPSGFSVSQ